MARKTMVMSTSVGLMLLNQDVVSIRNKRSVYRAFLIQLYLY